MRSHGFHKRTVPRPHFPCAKDVFHMWPCVSAHVKFMWFFISRSFFKHSCLTWLESVFGIHWLDRKSWASDMVWGAEGGAVGSFAQFKPVSPGWQVLLRADLWYNRGGRRGPSGLTQERKTTHRSLLRQLLLFCLLLAPQLLIDDNLNIILRGTHQ